MFIMNLTFVADECLVSERYAKEKSNQISMLLLWVPSLRLNRSIQFAQFISPLMVQPNWPISFYRTRFHSQIRLMKMDFLSFSKSCKIYNSYNKSYHRSFIHILSFFFKKKKRKNNRINATEHATHSSYQQWR